MTTGCDALSKSETVTIAAIEDNVRLLVEARDIIAAFNAIIRKKAEADLDRCSSGLGRASSHPSPTASSRRANLNLLQARLIGAP